MNENYCNNCGKIGHIYYECKCPIISNGIIAFRKSKSKNDYEYLMICRRNTLGLIDFMRGNYSVHNKEYILSMFKQMTITEKQNIMTKSFNELWCDLWGDTSHKSAYRNEQRLSFMKFTSLTNGIKKDFNKYDLFSLINESNNFPIWEEPEWGFPKGRRDNKENDFNCAVREFCEETGYTKNCINHIQNMVPVEEIFLGSNFKSYKHKYYIANMDNNIEIPMYEKSEVSRMEWKTYDECILLIRPYNLEKIKVLTNVHNTINSFTHLFT